MRDDPIEVRLLNESRAVTCSSKMNSRRSLVNL